MTGSVALFTPTSPYYIRLWLLQCHQETGMLWLHHRPTRCQYRQGPLLTETSLSFARLNKCMHRCVNKATISVLLFFLHTGAWTMEFCILGKFLLYHWSIVITCFSFLFWHQVFPGFPDSPRTLPVAHRGLKYENLLPQPPEAKSSDIMDESNHFEY